MFVKNNEARVHHIGEHCRLIPGINRVDDATWAKAKAIKLVQHYLDTKVLEEIVHKSGKSDLSSFSPAVQAELLKDVNDPELLKQVSQGAKGPAKEAAAEQLQELEAPLQPNEKAAEVLAKEAEEAPEQPGDQGGKRGKRR